MSLEVDKKIYEWLLASRCLKQITSFRALNAKRMQLDARITKKFVLGSQFAKIIKYIVRNNKDIVC